MKKRLLNLMNLRRALMPARILMLCVTMLTLGELTANAEVLTVVATVQSVGQEPVEYTDLEAAFAAAHHGDVIKLQDNCTLAADDAKGHLGKIVVGDGINVKEVEFDLNGYTVSGLADEFFGITTNARLIIEDSGSGGRIVTKGEKAIHNSGTLAVLGGSISGASCGIYSQGKLTVGGGTISGGDYGLYVKEGMTEVSGGSFVAKGTNGIGMECLQTVYFLGLPTFDCTLADISLASDQKLEFANGSYAVPAKKIKVKVVNEAPYTFTSAYGGHVWKEATGNLDPAKIFDYYDATAGLGVVFNSNGSEAVIGKCYALSGSRVMFYRNGIFSPVTTALEDEKITVAPALAPGSWPEGKYFTGEYTSEQVTVELLVEDYSGQPTGEGQFEMPTKDVTVDAGMGDQEEYVVDLTTAMSQTIPYSMTLLLPSMEVDNKNCTVYGDNGEWYLDLNGDKTNDLQVMYVSDEKTNEKTYYIERLSGENVYQTDCRFALSYMPPMQYSSVLFKFEGVLAVDTENPTVIKHDGDDKTTTYYPLTETVLDGLVRDSGSATQKNLIGGVAIGLPSGSGKDVLNGVKAIFKEDNIRKDGSKKVTIKFSQKGLEDKGTKVGVKKLAKRGTFRVITVGGKLKASKKIFNKLKAAFAKAGMKVKIVKNKKTLTRGDLPDDMSDDEELVLDPDVEYEVLEDCDLFFNVEFDDDAEEMEIEDVVVRQPGDANGDDKVDAADLVEMVNAKDGHPSENYNQLNADIDDDEDITQDDLDVVEDLIMEE